MVAGSEEEADEGVAAELEGREGTTGAVLEDLGGAWEGEFA